MAAENVELKDKIEIGLHESRTLVLGAQVLIGFQCLAIFAGGFEKLPHASQYLKVTALGFMLIAVGLLMA